MNIWIVTIGNSDVQLKTKEHWSDLHRKFRSQLETRSQFSVSESKQRVDNDKEENRWLYPARALGVVYGSAIQSSTEYYDDLAFPLLDSFTKYITSKGIEFAKIILIFTDQTAIISKANINDTSQPYWKDTCTLETILKEYFKRKFPKVEFQDKDILTLEPEPGTSGLDNWDRVLPLVREKVTTLDVPQDSDIYVSHQAGTPAISSAVQFSTLARFREKVRFLVSNEYSGKSQLLKGSTYFTEMQLQEARALLEGYDYAGVRSLVGESLEKEAKILLDAAILWNYAEFDEFRDELQKLSDEAFTGKVAERSQQWWWTAYESAYLAVVRLKQENTLEAMFHSFRALEGLVKEYAKSSGEEELLYGQRAFKYLKRQKPEEWERNLYLQNLIVLERSSGSEIRHDILTERNSLFHQLKGFKDNDLYNAWQVNDESDWQERVLQCLNFVSEQTFTGPLKNASLMYEVHRKLEEVLDRTP